VDGVIWSAAPPALPYSLRLFPFTSKEREGGAVFSSFSILYRISLFPFPFAVVCVFTFFFEKFVSDCVLLFLCVAASPHALLFPLLSFIKSSLLFAWPRLSIHSLLPQGDPRPLVVPYPYRIVSYRTILQYVFSSPSNRLTNQPSLRNLDGRYSTVYIFERSESGE
jgi:hypothetical protein